MRWRWHISWKRLCILLKNKIIVITMSTSYHHMTKLSTQLTLWSIGGPPITTSSSSLIIISNVETRSRSWVILLKLIFIVWWLLSTQAQIINLRHYTCFTRFSFCTTKHSRSPLTVIFILGRGEIFEFFLLSSLLSWLSRSDFASSTIIFPTNIFFVIV